MLRLDTAYGGLEVLARGGGRQTISLKMQTGDYRQYVFRSVDKDPVSALSLSLRRTIAAAITRDQTSSQQPYGALAVAPMLDKLGILHASPHLYVMPDDPKLEQFRSTFANMLGMVEERPTNGGKGTCLSAMPMRSTRATTSSTRCTTIPTSASTPGSLPAPACSTS
ncbi:MAG: hypothetical protein H6560_04065 [Lewinellaceae bacterium]|nr:hypothetical protein [Lewinellaceae bacterium]